VVFALSRRTVKGAKALDVTLDDLRAVLGDQLSTSETIREQHGTDESHHPPHPPDAVAFPRTTEEVAAIVRLCRRDGVPVIPFGAGTSLEGHVAALHGGVCLNMSLMNRVLAVNVDDLDARVEAGVSRRQLNERLRFEGLFFPVDPGADASLGGMAATRASGTTTIRYGSMRDNVLGLTVVLADGRVIRTGSRARKSAAGYDLTRLFIGSEGTLGVITELTVRLYGVPEVISAAVCSFPTVKDAVTSVIRAIQFGVPIARAELLDDRSMHAVNRHAGSDHPAAPTVFFEFHGSEVEVTDQTARVGAIAGDLGGELRAATDAKERNELWSARHNAYYAALALRPGAKGLVTDVCVPISRLAECITQTQEDLARSCVPACVLGHVGDGNFHVIFSVYRDHPEEVAEADRLHDRLVQRALDMEGTCTGEHGVGHGKIRYMEAEHGDGVDVMRRLKAALDPDGLLNPGKLLAPE
jgi:D-lactate dehydrogenase (cytochrome)